MKPKFLGFEAGYRDYILGHAARIHNNWGHNPEAVRKSHETQKSMYESGELVIWNKGLDMTDERVRNNVEKVLANPNRGKNISKKLKGVKKSDEHVMKIRENAKIRWANPDEREMQSHRRMQYIIANGFTPKSNLEEKFVNILLTEFNLTEEDYIRQFYVREIKALFDFKILHKKILIEVDGDFWHCNPNSRYSEPIYESQKGNIKQDKIKNEWCERNGYKLLRFWEMDINNNPEKVIEVLKRELGLSQK